MNILTNENRTYDLDAIPSEVDDIRYCVLDCSDKNDLDFFFLPLIFLESFYAPAIVLELGNHTIKMPMDWSILVCDEDYGDLEVIPLTSLNDRGFHSLVFNPLKHFVPTTHEVNIVDVYADVKWFFPKLKNGNVLVVPLEGGHEPLCALFVKEGNKIPDPLDIAQLLQ